MKPRVCLWLAVATLPCAAQSTSSPNPNRFQATARLSFNVEASVGASEGTPSSGDPGPATGHGINRNYDDGYVRVDADHNAGGLTWYWGYRDASQVPGDGTLRLHHTSASGSGSGPLDPETAGIGAEIAWLRDLHRTDHFAFGTKLAGSYVRFDFGGAPSSTLTRFTDTYDLGGIVPPGDPTKPGYQYAGVRDLPGPLIPDQPSSRDLTTLPGSGSRTLDADVWAFKLGGWIEHPFGQAVTAQLGGGFAFAVVDASLSYNEGVSGGGSASQSEVLFGGYIEAAVTTRITERLDWVVSAELMPLTSYRETLAGRSVELDFGTAWSLNLGFSYRF